jgi:hypothetical protein
LRRSDQCCSVGVDEGSSVEVDGRWLIGSKKPFVPRIPLGGDLFLQDVPVFHDQIALESKNVGSD